LNDSGQNTLEQIKLELNTRLEEYKALRAEIVTTLTAAYQTISLTLTAVGILVAGSISILQSPKPTLFAVASFVFYALAWIQLRYEQAVFNMSNRIIDVVAPAIRKDLNAVSPRDNNYFDDVLSWESDGRKVMHSNEWFFYPIEASRYIIPLLAGTIALSAYLFVIYQRSKIDCITDGLILLTNISFLLYSIIATFRIRSRLKRGKDA
jgi:hypothetical protein